MFGRPASAKTFQQEAQEAHDKSLLVPYEAGFAAFAPAMESSLPRTCSPLITPFLPVSSSCYQEIKCIISFYFVEIMPRRREGVFSQSRQAVRVGRAKYP